MEINRFNYSNISTHRNKLMGIGTLSVLVLHFLYWCNLFDSSYPIVKILKIIPRLVFTDGFIILSGFGLFYSFTKNRNILNFYYKRFLRLYFPFVIMSFIFYIFLCNTIKNYLLSVSGLYFFFYGNNGMWYISISLFFYLLFPFLYKTLKNFYTECITLSLLTSFPLAIYWIFPDYFSLTEIGITLFPYFYFGIILGKLSYEKKEIKIWHLIILVILACLLFICKDFTICLKHYYHSYIRLLTIFVLSFLFEVSGKLKISYFCLSYLGRYSLEIYILHMLSYQLLSRYINISWINCVIAILASLIFCKPVNLLYTNIIKRIFVKKGENVHTL